MSQHPLPWNNPPVLQTAELAPGNRGSLEVEEARTADKPPKGIQKLNGGALIQEPLGTCCIMHLLFRTANTRTGSPLQGIALPEYPK